MTRRPFFSLTDLSDMALNRQNRTIAILAVIVFSVLAYLFFKDSSPKIEEGSEAEQTEEVIEENVATQENMGDQVTGTTLLPTNPVDTEEQKTFGLIIGDIADCLDLKISELDGSPEVKLDSLTEVFQSELGQASFQADRWQNWHMRMRDGKERRIRLEISENDEGKVTKELKYFSVDREGQPSTIEQDDEKSLNPSDETLDQLLKEGEVFFKERAAYVVFPNGERIEYLEKDGTLSEIEIIKGDRYYRCGNISERDSCQCIR